MTDLSALDAFINESIKRSRDLNYNPTTFVQMRERWGTKEAIQRLVESGDIQSGFVKAIDLGLRDWTLEAAVLKFPDLFLRRTREAAQFRLSQAEGNP